MDATVGSIVVFAVCYLFIATERLDKTAVVLLGASACVMMKFVPYHAALQAVDLNVIFLLVGMMLAVNIMADTGLFEWLAVTLARRARGNGLRILLTFLIATAALSAVLDNVTTVLLIAPITILICEILELPVILFLVLEALASNIGGAATLVGDPPNVLIGSKTGLSFNAFLVNLGPPILVMLGVGFVVGALALRSRTVVDAALKERILHTRPHKAILDPSRMKRSLAVFGLILGGFFASHAVGLEPGIIALGGSLLMALVCKVDLEHSLRRVEWNSVFFFVGLFMLIGALEYNGVFEHLGNEILAWTEGNFLLTVLTVLWFSAIASALVDNIPLVLAMIPLIQTLVPVFGAQMGLGDAAALRSTVEEPLYWALALGACLGGNGTLVGASANIVVAQVGRRNGYPVTFMTFTRYGFPVMIGTLLISTLYLYLRYFT